MNWIFRLISETPDYHCGFDAITKPNPDAGVQALACRSGDNHTAKIILASTKIDYRSGKKYMEFKHEPVMLSEIIEMLRIKPDGIYIDGTAGGAGHSMEIARRLITGRLLALDKDPDAIKTARKRLESFSCAEVAESDFSEMKTAAKKTGISNADGILLDIGVSSYQLDNAERGFSYLNDAPLDMRMNKSGISAREVVNNYTKEELVRILRDYGEEKFAVRIAENIVLSREKSPIESTYGLLEIIRKSVPARVKRDKNPARKTFQAIRIEVNNELEILQTGLQSAFELLKSGGRLCVITFHSLEDRIVKNYFSELSQGCICSKKLPICVCENNPKAKKIIRKPLEASEKELLHNPRSRSAKLRVLEKL